MSKKKKKRSPSNVAAPLKPQVLEVTQRFVTEPELPVLEEPCIAEPEQAQQSDEQSLLQEHLEQNMRSLTELDGQLQQSDERLVEEERLDQDMRSLFELDEQPNEPNEQAPSEVAGIFQAVGVIVGAVKFGDEGKTAVITIDSKDYPLFYAPRLRKAFDALKMEVERTGEQQKIVVYPRLIHLPDRTKLHQVSFQLVAFAGNSENDSSVSQELEPFEFKLSGLWQFIPVSRIPCISVFKNYSTERKEYIKKQDDASKKARYMKASHIPLIWKDAVVPPFRFNPTLEKEQQAKTYFVSIKAKFNPRSDLFEFGSMTALPQDKAPRFLKVSKTDKAEAARVNMKARKAIQPKPHSKAASKPVPKPVIKPKVATNSDSLR